MDVEDYRAARRTRLVELARGLGVPAGEAERLVDRVVEAQRRRISRADDPDDVVVPALRDEVLGRRSRVVPAAVLAFVVLVVGAFAVALVHPPHHDPDPPPDDSTVAVPSLLGLTADEAASTLARAHVPARVVSVPQCGPAGLVLGSVPPMGTDVGSDGVVAVIATSTPQWACPDDGGARATGWSFLRFLVSGSARPDFAPAVRLLVDGRQVGVVRGTDPTTPPGWWAVMRGPVVRYVSRPVANDLGQPIVSVTRGVLPPTTCGQPTVAPAGVAASSTRMMLTVGDEAPGVGCELTIDLFEDARGAVSAVALTTPGPVLGPPAWVRRPVR